MHIDSQAHWRIRSQMYFLSTHCVFHSQGSTVRYRIMAYVWTELSYIRNRKVSRWSWGCWVTQSLLLLQKHTNSQIHSFMLTRLHCNQACCLLAHSMQVIEDHWKSSVNSRLELCVSTISSTAWFCKKWCREMVMTMFSVRWQEKTQLLVVSRWKLERLAEHLPSRCAKVHDEAMT